MKTSFIILIFVAVVSAVVCVCLLCMKFAEWQSVRNLSKNAINFNEKNKGAIKESVFVWLLRNGVSFLIRPCNYLIKRFPFIENFFSNLVEILEDKNIKTSKNAVASVIVLFSFIIASLVSLIFSSALVGIAVLLLIFICLGVCTKAILDKKIVNLRNTIPETLRSMSLCFGAGYTLYQTFNQLSQETKGAIQKLFSKSSHVLQTGGSVSQALAFLKNAKDAPELAFVAVALDVQHQTGGSMKPVIDSAKDMVENKLELMRLLEVQTAQAKLSARIVMVLPFALVALFSIISPGFLTPFFSSILGFIMLIVAVVMQAAGIILVKKMLNVEI